VLDRPQWKRICELGLQNSTWLQNKGKSIATTAEYFLTEYECRHAGLPYGFDGIMYAHGKHVHAYSRDKPYGDYHGTYHYQLHLCKLSEYL